VATDVTMDNLNFHHDLHVFAPEFSAFVVQFTQQLGSLLPYTENNELVQCTHAIVSWDRLVGWVRFPRKTWTRPHTPHPVVGAP
jgi:hypothetical protein